MGETREFILECDAEDGRISITTGDDTYKSFCTPNRDGSYLDEYLNKLKRGDKITLTIEKEKRFFRYGQRFVFGSTKLILAQINARELVLVCLSSGNRWSDPIVVNDSCMVTETEFKLLVGTENRIDEFELDE